MSSNSSSALPSACENSTKQIPHSKTDAFSDVRAGFTTFPASAISNGDDDDDNGTSGGGGGNCTGGGESRRTIISISESRTKLSRLRLRFGDSVISMTSSVSSM